MNHPDQQDRSPAIAELLDDAFVAPVGIDTASRHLWAIRSEAARLAEASAVPPAGTEPPSDGAAGGRDLVGAGAGSGGMHRAVPRAAVPLLVVVLMMSGSGMALAASQSSLPGDVLYPVKRGTEQAQLIFARSPEARTQLQLSFARTRLDEIRRIATTRPQHVPALVAAINVTLTEVEGSAPASGPASDQLRQEITAEIAALELSPDLDDAVDVALSAPVENAVTVTTPPTEVVVESAPSAIPTATPTATPVPSAAGTATPTPRPSPATSGEPTPTDTPAAVALDPVAPQPSSPAPSSTPTPSPSSSPTPSPTQSASPSPTPTDREGPVITVRPDEDPDGDGSRADDGSDDGDPGHPTPTSSPTAPPPDDGSQDEDMPPFVRPRSDS